ncbi:LAGLIDADG family homing endonuclease [Candidatus Kaiserbacteria bacterium]|nr:LAGLIDADG family homing endonuclease [Candidatus Kaiserbacteria bacterium]
MGSRLNLNKAYIAGFLDGDGSLMLQVKVRDDTKRGARFMATICLYQDTRHEEPLHWIRKMLKIGYISRRSDGMSELRINGFEQVRKILTDLKPYIRFKAKQTSMLIKACRMLESRRMSELSDIELRALVTLVFAIKQENYKSKSSLTEDVLHKRLGLTP